MTDLYAVAGKPVLHSRSPQMHDSAFKRLGIDAVYLRLAAESAEEALETASEMGMKGLNVTAPFKEEMASLVEAADDGARALGAVNTVVLDGGGPKGYNTDPDGAALALKENGVRLKGAKAVVLGAGGAAKAAAFALMREGSSVTLANRTVFKAEKAARELGCDLCGVDSLDLSGADVLVSALSTTERVVPPEALHGDLAVLDANYSSETSLARDARERGCDVIDGREWLFFQGVKAFGIFTGREAPVPDMRKGLYSNGGRKRETENIALIGMMGSGKDAVSGEIGALSGRGLIDLDRRVESRAGKEISRIFAEDGEAAFRKLEEEELLRALGDGGVINCGGGAIIGERGRKEIKNRALGVWLWAEPKTLASRVKQGDARPLLGGGDPEERLEDILKERMRLYAEACDMVISTGRITPRQAAERLLYEIR